jgi:hypothetical protein
VLIAANFRFTRVTVSGRGKSLFWLLVCGQTQAGPAEPVKAVIADLAAPWQKGNAQQSLNDTPALRSNQFRRIAQRAMIRAEGCKHKSPILRNSLATELFVSAFIHKVAENRLQLGYTKVPA